MVSAHCDASLRLCWCHHRALTSVSSELLPCQGKLCKELQRFISSLSLCCQAPHVPTQQRQSKPRQTTKVHHDLPRIACEAVDCPGRKHHRVRAMSGIDDQPRCKPPCGQCLPGAASNPGMGSRHSPAGTGRGRLGSDPPRRPHGSPISSAGGAGQRGSPQPPHREPPRPEHRAGAMRPALAPLTLALAGQPHPVRVVASRRRRHQQQRCGRSRRHGSTSGIALPGALRPPRKVTIATARRRPIAAPRVVGPANPVPPFRAPTRARQERGPPGRRRRAARLGSWAPRGWRRRRYGVRHRQHPGIPFLFPSPMVPPQHPQNTGSLSPAFGGAPKANPALTSQL